ncbi:hypothetical protein CC80DRAFT_163619 [Byssothecium circinans]|uniref:Uncharacterized protein n=1 Tax=Byssothecium circinans TaxID=147558 RepID=A0A6A5UCF0_9PLEO|nr:hypothetical protein CC80DRAFT_163619 [Byssothecium circinans]
MDCKLGRLTLFYAKGSTCIRLLRVGNPLLYIVVAYNILIIILILSALSLALAFGALVVLSFETSSYP